MAKRVTRIGRYRVEDGSTLKSGDDELTLDELAGYQRRAARTVLREVRPIEPEVLRYARKTIGFTQEDVAQVLGVTPETVSRWETGSEPFKPAIQFALADLVDMFERQGGPEGVMKAIAPGKAGTITLKAS